MLHATRLVWGATAMVAVPFGQPVGLNVWCGGRSSSQRAVCKLEDKDQTTSRLVSVGCEYLDHPRHLLLNFSHAVDQMLLCGRARFLAQHLSVLQGLAVSKGLEEQLHTCIDEAEREQRQ